MMVVGNKPGRFFTFKGDVGGPRAPPPADGLAPDSIDDLFADPEVCRRVGSIIAKGAERRRPQIRPAPRSGRSGSTN